MSSFLHTGGRHGVHVQHMRASLSQNLGFDARSVLNLMCVETVFAWVLRRHHIRTLIATVSLTVSAHQSSVATGRRRGASLLEGIDKCGAGNWKVIAEYMGTGKSAKQLEEHYWEVYMGVTDVAYLQK